MTGPPVTRHVRRRIRCHGLRRHGDPPGSVWRPRLRPPVGVRCPRHLGGYTRRRKSFAALRPEVVRWGTPSARPIPTRSPPCGRSWRGTARHTGEEFFRTLVRNLSAATVVASAFVAEFAGSNTRVRSLAYWSDGSFLPGVEWDLRGTPCEDVGAGRPVPPPDRRDGEVPRGRGPGRDRQLPGRSRSGTPRGRCSATWPSTTRGRCPPSRGSSSRSRSSPPGGPPNSTGCGRTGCSGESEERFRDLFDEAPIAYVHEDLDSRFPPRQPDRAPHARRPAGRGGRVPRAVAGPGHARRAAARGGGVRLDRPRGGHTAGVVLELRRKDDGRPLWVRWWSRPDPGGAFTPAPCSSTSPSRCWPSVSGRGSSSRTPTSRRRSRAAHNFDEIVGRSPALVSVLQRVSKVAATGLDRPHHRRDGDRQGARRAGR